MQRKYCKSLSGERVGGGCEEGCVWGVCVCVRGDGDASSLNFKYFFIFK